MADERTYKMLLGDIAGSGSGGLPDYSEANDGDVLAIENGEPAWAAPGGGGGAVIITDNGTQLDKTYAEIYALVKSGTPCYIKYNLYGFENDIDTDYSHQVELLPIVAVMKYNDVYRVFASCAAGSTISSAPSAGSPAIWAYQASVSTDYPTFYRRSYVASSNMTADINRTV